MFHVANRARLALDRLHTIISEINRLFQFETILRFLMLSCEFMIYHYVLIVATSRMSIKHSLNTVVTHLIQYLKL